MASSVSGVSGNSASNQSTQADAAAAANSSLGGEQVFLQLLVSQIKNQDPLNPMDSTTFVTQLAQFSQLEGILGIRSDLKTFTDQVTTPAPTGSTPTPSAT